MQESRASRAAIHDTEVVPLPMPKGGASAVTQVRRTWTGRVPAHPYPFAMRLTRFTDNALRCLMYLGRNGGRTITVGEVADRMAMSEDHLLKVVRRLVELGYVSTVRGRKGGVRLAMAPDAINVGDVVRSTEDNLALVPCFAPGDESCPLTPSCSLATTLDEALGAFFAALKRRTLADLIGVQGTGLGARGTNGVPGIGLGDRG